MFGSVGAVSKIQLMSVENHHPLLSWNKWCEAVVAVLRAELADSLRSIRAIDVDWPAWRCYYEAGRTPRAAVARALERDL